MNKRKLISLLIVLVITVLYRYFQDFRASKDHKNTPIEIKDQSKKKNSDQDINIEDLRTQRVRYTKHALCRMECRKIDESEVLEILQEGHVNWKKTDVNDQPCPSFALEGTTHDRQRVRIVYAGCEKETRVITAIDLDMDWPCDCQ